MSTAEARAEDRYEKQQSESTLPAPVAASKEMGERRPWSSSRELKRYLMTEVEPALATAPLAAYCFMTGFMYVRASLRLVDELIFRSLHSDAISFSAIFVWCGFQTGNTVQVRRLLHI